MFLYQLSAADAAPTDPVEAFREYLHEKPADGDIKCQWSSVSGATPIGVHGPVAFLSLRST